MINKIIAKRKSIRDFDSSLLDEETTISLFEAARRAPSAFNEQPWRFILADKKNIEEFNSLLNVLNDKNKEWAQNASLLVIVLSKKTLTRNNKINRHYLYDTASAVANLTFQANSLDLYVHQMGGFDSGKVIDNYFVPDDFEPAVVIAIGKKVVEDKDDFVSQIELRRNSLSEILFESKFGNSHSILNKEIVTNN